VFHSTIATPGSTKEKSDKAWTTKHYVALSIVAGVVIVTGIIGFRHFKNHASSLSNQGVKAAANAASKKKEFL
jgi:hypothetical protein